MRTIRISEEVWAAIATQGKFGETEDDVLRRVFKIPLSDSHSKLSIGSDLQPVKNSNQYGWKERRATHRMSDKTGKGNRLILEFDHGARFERLLPPKNDPLAIRKIRNEAILFVRSNKGTKGQEQAAIKALTDRGYFVAKQIVDSSEFA